MNKWPESYSATYRKQCDTVRLWSSIQILLDQAATDLQLTGF